jgi:Rieske Fe-S protein
MTDSADLTPVAALASQGATRRTVLRAAGLVALVGGSAGALAACSSGEPSASRAGSAPSASSTALAEVNTADVPVGGGVIMENADYVVTQPKKGSYKAFSKICTHAGCPVSSIADAQIICNCHQSHYSIVDGSVISGPAPKPLPEKKATVSGAKIVVSG